MSDKIVQLNEKVIKTELKELVRQSVEEVLNGLLDEEADRLTNARKYERTEGRRDTRAGHYTRKLLTGAGEVELEVPKLRTLTFETAIIERYKRREASVEEALVEMYLAGVSTRRVEDITQLLWNAKLSAGTVSRLNVKVYEQIEAWRNRALEGKYPYVYLDGIYLKRNWGGEYRNVAVLIAMAVNQRGEREVIGAAEGMKEDKES
jgi:putative transposase